MNVIPASRVVVGHVIDDEPVYTIVDHPSGLAFLDWNGEPILTGLKPNSLVTVSVW